MSLYLSRIEGPPPKEMINREISKNSFLDWSSSRRSIFICLAKKELMKSCSLAEMPPKFDEKIDGSANPNRVQKEHRSLPGRPKSLEK